MKRCAKCIMSDTKPGIVFDEKGVCNACQFEEEQDKVDWAEREAQLRQQVEFVKSVKPDGYNCLVAVSGGKDSTFICLTARDLGLNVLGVCVEPCEPTPRGQRNLRNLSRLGFDILVFKPNQRIMPQLLLRSLVEDGQPVRAFEFMLYSVPIRTAIDKDIPFVLWGEGAQHYGNVGTHKGGSAAVQKDCAALAGANASHWLGDGVAESDLISFQHPSEEEIEDAGVEAMYLSHYIRWDSRMTGAFAVMRGLEIRPDYEIWKSGGYWPFEQLDDEGPIVSHLLKHIKFGYGRATDQACRDIRMGYITREEGLQLAKMFDGLIAPEYLQRYCDYLRITTDEFWAIANKWRGDMWEAIDGEWRLPSTWYEGLS